MLPWSRSAVVLACTTGVLLAGCSGNALRSSPSRPSTPAPLRPTPDGERFGTPTSTPSTPVRACRWADLRPDISGGGPALGYVSVVLRFTDVGPPCTLGGWPVLTAISRREHAEVVRHLVMAPALAAGSVSGPATVGLRTGEAAYLIVDGSDVPSGTACPPPYRRFLVRLPGISIAFAVRAHVPNGWDYFPACVPLGVSPVVAKADIIPKMR